MADLTLKLKDAVGKIFDLATGVKHFITLIRPKVFVLDAEDEHFNFDRKVLLPDLSSTDGSEPVLDARRVTGIGVIYAALVHAQKHASQKLFVTGHTDPSGAASYNQKLSDDRAANVSLLLRGKREDWRKLSAKDDAVDDVQAVLKWQAERAGWDCDPGKIDNDLGTKTHQALRGFQERYNAEVDKAQSAGLDSPFKQKMTVDGDAGPETWGAFYDLYMTELMNLLDLTAYSALQQMQAALSAPPGMVDFVGCGEHIPFNPVRRDPFEQGKDEHLEGPQKNPADRRVEILFFDPGEEVDLPCHPAPGKCKPEECKVYFKVPHRQVPIGIPKGLTITEVNLRLTFVDPEGKVRPLPEGLPIQAKFGDPADDVPTPVPFFGAVPPSDVPILDDDDTGLLDPDADASDPAPASAPDPDAPDSLEEPQEPTATVGPNGVLQFVVARKSSSLYLRFLVGKDKPFVTADPNNLADTKLAGESELNEAVGQGRVYLRLPTEFNTQQGYFDLPTPGGVTFSGGAFQNFDNKETELGSREAPLELQLGIHWQHFQFEYFDRWTSSLTVVPQPRSKDASGVAVAQLALEGASTLIETDTLPIPVEARSAWDVGTGPNTVHCLAWVRREAPKGQAARALPDANCTARFFTIQPTFVRTDGDGSSPSAPRVFVSFDASDATPSTPGAARLQLYDLPRDWRSRLYPARLSGETPDKARPFEQVAGTASTLSKPYIVPLDVVVLQGQAGPGPDSAIQFDDTNLANRFTIFDNQLAVHKPDPASGEPYFTRVASLKPAPSGPVFVDVPPFTRLIAKGRFLYDVFDRRVPALSPLFKGVPVGARLALRLPDNKTTDEGSKAFPHTVTAAPFQAADPNSTNLGFSHLGSSRTALLRCCGHAKNVELFNVIQYLTVSFDFARPITPAVIAQFSLLKNAASLSAPPPNATASVRDALLAIASRWNGGDALNSIPTTFEVGAPVTAQGRYVAFLSHGVLNPPPPATTLLPAEVRISFFKTGRAFMSGAEGWWGLDRLAPSSSGRLTAAHETGHIFGQPDEYLNTDFLPSYDQPNIGENARSAGTPYGIDLRAMMVTDHEIRGRYFWELLLFASARGHFADAKTLAVKRGPLTFSTDITPLDQSRVRFPLSQRLGATPGPLGLCDIFLYSTGHDEFCASLDPSAKATPYDGFVVVRVKMDWDMGTTTAFDEILALMNRAQIAIGSTYNRGTRLAIRASLGGKAVRLRMLFAPRFNGSTFPSPLDAGANTYLGKLDGMTAPFKKSDYDALATATVALFGVHAIVRLQDGTPGVQNVGVPRPAIVRKDKSILGIFTSSRFDDDVIETFGQLIGVPANRTGTVADYAALLAQLPPELTKVVPEIVP